MKSRGARPFGIWSFPRLREGASCPAKVAKRGLSPTYTISGPHTHWALYFATRYCPGGSESVLKLPQRQTGSRHLSARKRSQKKKKQEKNKKALARMRLDGMWHIVGNWIRSFQTALLIRSAETTDYLLFEKEVEASPKCPVEFHYPKHFTRRIDSLIRR